VFCTATIVGKRFLGAPAGTVKRRTGRATGGKRPTVASKANRVGGSDLANEIAIRKGAEA